VDNDYLSSVDNLLVILSKSTFNRVYAQVHLPQGQDLNLRGLRCSQQWICNILICIYQNTRCHKQKISE